MTWPLAVLLSVLGIAAALAYFAWTIREVARFHAERESGDVLAKLAEVDVLAGKLREVELDQERLRAAWQGMRPR